MDEEDKSIEELERELALVHEELASLGPNKQGEQDDGGAGARVGGDRMVPGPQEVNCMNQNRGMEELQRGSSMKENENKISWNGNLNQNENGSRKRKEMDSRPVEDFGKVQVQRCAKDVATILNERNFKMIHDIVAHVGVTQTYKIMRMTKEKMDNGGELTSDGTRKKSKGGVFMKCARSVIGNAQFAKLATADTKRRKKKRHFIRSK